MSPTELLLIYFLSCMNVFGLKPEQRKHRMQKKQNKKNVVLINRPINQIIRMSHINLIILDYIRYNLTLISDNIDYISLCANHLQWFKLLNKIIFKILNIH